MTKLNRSIDRGLTVLEVVHASGAVSLAVLAARTGLPKATLLRICATLEARRWLLRRASDGRYQLASTFPHGGGTPKHIDRLVAVAKDELLRLSRETGHGSDLAAGIGGGRVEIVDTTRQFKVHGVYPDTVGFRPSPVLSALGRAFLSGLSSADRAQALRDLEGRMPRGDLQALPGLAATVRRIEARGYATRSEGYWGRAVDYGALPAAIALPIVAGPEVVGAINLVWTASDRSETQVATDHLARLRQAARTIGCLYADDS